MMDLLKRDARRRKKAYDRKRIQLEFIVNTVLVVMAVGFLIVLLEGVNYLVG